MFSLLHMTVNSVSLDSGATKHLKTLGLWEIFHYLLPFYRENNEEINPENNKQINQ